MEELDPEFIISKGEWFRETKVTPPYTEDELNKILMFRFLGLSFLQENGLTTRIIVNTVDDVKSSVLKRKDLTSKGFEFYRTVYEPTYMNIPDFTKDPQERVKAILEKNLKRV